jgi:hypothetical protein
MNETPESSNRLETLTLEEARQELLCNNDGSCRCPGLDYERVTSSDSENRINKAFDILFQEVMNVRKSINPNEISSHLRTGFDRPTGRGANH